jgi:hypothetical protein
VTSWPRASCPGSNRMARSSTRRADPCQAYARSDPLISLYLAGACIVCEEPGPQVTYQVPHGLVVHLHSRCDTLWQEEQRQRHQ